MHLYAFELGFILKKKLLKKLDLQATIGLGMATISKRTERLAKGFTFIENFSLGFSKIDIILALKSSRSSSTRWQMISSKHHWSGVDFQSISSLDRPDKRCWNTH